MSGAGAQLPRGAVLAQVVTLLKDRPDGLLLGEVAAAVGRPSALMSVLLRQYVVAGHLETVGQRPATRYRLAPPKAEETKARVSATQPAKAEKAAPGGASREQLIAAFRNLLSSLDLSPEDLLPSSSVAEQQLVTPAVRVSAPAPAPVLAKPKALPRPPGPKPVERRSFIPFTPSPKPQPASIGAKVVVPEHVQVKVCPSGRDTRFQAEPGAQGGGFMAEWRRLRGDA